MSTEYGKRAARNMVEVWKRHGITNPLRFKKIADKYKAIEAKKGWEIAQKIIYETHGFPVSKASGMFPEYFAWPKGEEPYELYWKKRDKVALWWREEEAFNSNILSAYEDLEQLRFAVIVFGNMKLGPLGRFYQGIEKNGHSFNLFFDGDYRLYVLVESYLGDDLGREFDVVWRLERDNEPITSGQFVDDRFFRHSDELAFHILSTSIPKICVEGESVPEWSRWPVTSREAQNLFAEYGPFVLTSDKEGADAVLVRKEGNLFWKHPAKKDAL